MDLSAYKVVATIAVSEMGRAAARGDRRHVMRPRRFRQGCRLNRHERQAGG